MPGKQKNSGENFKLKKRNITFFKKYLIMSTSEGNKKATKGRYIPSRYKQAAKKVADQGSKDSTSTTIVKQNTTRAPTKSTQLSNPDLTNISSQSSQSSDSGSLLQTRCTSTPDLHKFVSLPSINASAISNVDSTFCKPRMRENLATNRKNLRVKKPFERETFHRGPLVVAQADKKSSDLSYDEAAEEELDIAYAEYLQAVFLESEAKKSLELSSKNAFETIHKVWSLIQILMEKDKTYDRELDNVSYMIHLHKHLCEQEQMLAPILEIFPSLLTKYKTIAEAVDSVRHKLAVNGIAPLDSIAEEEVISLLKSFEVSLEQFLKTLPEQKSLSHAADTISTFASHGKNINQELNRCTDSLCKADDLLVTETSLTMSALQLRDL